MIITATEFKAAREVSASVKDSKINPIIEDTELIELIPRLGRLLYNDLISTPEGAENAALLAGGTYEYGGNTYTHSGVKKVLIDFAYAYYRFLGVDTDTPFGFVEKQTPDGRHTERNRNKEMFTHYKQVAEQRWGEVSLFLDRNSDTYPLWVNLNNNCGSPRGFFTISKIST